MLFDWTYKKALERMPDGVFLFDRKLRVFFTNAAFKRLLSDGAKGNGTLAQVLGCAEKEKCGQGENCGYCSFYKAMRAAVESNTEQVEILHTTVKHADRTDKLSLRIRILPIDKGKTYLGITDGTYHTEIEQELLPRNRCNGGCCQQGRVWAESIMRICIFLVLALGGICPTCTS